MAEGAGRVLRPRPVRRLRVPELETEPPVVRLHAAEPRQDADQAGELHRGRLGERLGGDERRGEQLPPHPREVAERPANPGGRRALELRREPQRLEHRAAQVVGERHLGRLLDRLADDLEARVGVDAPLARLRDR